MAGNRQGEGGFISFGRWSINKDIGVKLCIRLNSTKNWSKFFNCKNLNEKIGRKDRRRLGRNIGRVP